MYMTKAGSKIRSQKDRIIKMYNDGIRILDIAIKYNVTESSIYKYFRDWGVEIIRGKTPYQKRRSGNRHNGKKMYHNKPTKSSLNLLACREVNQKINNKQIHFIDTINSVRDKKLIRNILYRSFM